MKTNIRKYFNMSSLIVIIIVGLLFFVAAKQVEAACVCVGTSFKSTNCSYCPSGNDCTTQIRKSGDSGSCTSTSTCTQTNAGTLIAGCSNPSVNQLVQCGDCPGGYKEGSLGYNSTEWIRNDCVSCGGGGGSCTESCHVDSWFWANNGTLQPRCRGGCCGGDSCRKYKSGGVRGCACRGGGGGVPTPTPAPDFCDISLSPTTTTITTGSDTTFTVSEDSPTVGTIDYVEFIPGDSGILNPNPTQDTTSVYSTLGEGVSIGSTTLTANVYMSAVLTCSDTTGIIDVIGVSAWWQAEDYTLLRRGSIFSEIPSTCSGGCLPNLGLDGAGGFPGLAVYGTTIDTGTGGISSNEWGVNTTLSSRKTYDYDFFARQLPDSITSTYNEITSTTIDGTVLSSGGTSVNGYYWYHFDGSLGDLTINSNVDLGDRKVVLMVDGADLIIEGRIFLNDGTGFFAAFVGENSSGGKGDILVDGGVSHATQPELEGLFLADDEFRTGTLGAGSDTQLHVNGMISSETNIVIERDLTDNSDTPAFLLEYAPELTLLMPKELMTKSYKWEEVAP